MSDTYTIKDLLEYFKDFDENSLVFCTNDLLTPLNIVATARLEATDKKTKDKISTTIMLIFESKKDA